MRRYPFDPPAAVPEYVDRDPALLRLDNNTNPRVHPALRTLSRDVASLELNRYGSAWGAGLRAELARFYGRDPADILVGNGSDEILDTAARAYLRPGRTGAMVRPGYDLYATMITRQGARLAELALGPDLGFPDLSRGGYPADLFYLASPHNPTGRILWPDELEAASRRVRGIVVVDEAYAEYSDQDLWETGLALGNVLFTRTFSKAWGLAGLRIGYGIAPTPLAERLRRFQIPFTLGTLAESAAVLALRRPGFVRESVARVRAERLRLAGALKGLGFRVFPSEANFLFTYPPIDGERLWTELRRFEILVRRTGPTPACPHPLRITVGTRRDSDRLVSALRRILRPSVGGAKREPNSGRST